MRRRVFVLGSAAAVSLGGGLAAWRGRPAADEPVDPAPLPPPVDAAGRKPVVRSAGPLPPPPDRYHGSEPAVAADADGRVAVVALDHGPGAAGRRLLSWASADGGKTWPAAAPLGRWPTAAAHNVDPWLAADGAGRFFLALLGSDLGGAGGGLRVSEDGGRTWGPAAAVTGKHVDKTVLAVAPGGARLAFLCVGARPGYPDCRPLLYRSADAGRTWKELPTPAELRAPLPDGGWTSEWAPPGGGRPIREHATHPVPIPTGLALRTADRLAAGWMVVSPRPGHRAAVVGTTADGGRTWATTTLATYPFDVRQGGPAVACDRDGTLFVAHPAPKAGGKGLEAVVRTSADGRTWSDPARVSSADADTCRYQAVCAANNLVHLAWVEDRGGKRGVWYRGSSDGGKTWSDPLPLGGPPAGDDWEFAGDYLSVADDGRGTAHVVWAQEPPDKPGAVWHARVEWAAR